MGVWGIPACIRNDDFPGSKSSKTWIMRVAVGRRGFSRIIFHSSGEFWLFLPKRGSAIYPTPRSSPSDPIMHCFRATNHSPTQFLGYQVICYPYFPPFLVVSEGLCLDQPNTPVYAACSDADFPLPPYGYNIPPPIHTSYLPVTSNLMAKY